MNRTTISAASALVAATCLVAACGPEGAQSAGPVPSLSTSAAATSPPATSGGATATPSPSSTTTAKAATPLVNPALAAAFDRLAERSRALRSDSGLGAIRASVSEGLAGGRSALSATREAAYRNGARDCGDVLAHLRATQSAAARVANAGAGLTTAAAGRQKQLDALNASIADVRRLAAGQPKTGGVPSAAEIAAALTVAASQSSTEAAALAQARAVTADGVVRARSMATTAAQIHAKAC